MKNNKMHLLKQGLRRRKLSDYLFQRRLQSFVLQKLISRKLRRYVGNNTRKMVVPLRNRLQELSEILSLQRIQKWLRYERSKQKQQEEESTDISNRYDEEWKNYSRSKKTQKAKRTIDIVNRDIHSKECKGTKKTWK